MRVPLSWLREYVDLCRRMRRPKTCTRRSCASGFEEEDVHRFDLQGPIVVGEVARVRRGAAVQRQDHPLVPGARRARRRAAADGGDAVHGIVCGARNFFVGDKVVVTLPGAVLPGPFPIAARKTYGHVSDGMIASARELGLGDEHDGILRLVELGIDAPVGTDAIALLGLDDVGRRDQRDARPRLRASRSAASPASTRTPPARPSATRRRAGGRGAAPAAASRVAVDDDAPDPRPRRRIRVRHAHRARRRPDPAARPPWMIARLKLAGIRSSRHPDRHHQLRDARARPADPRLRPRQARRRHHRAPRERRARSSRRSTARCARSTAEDLLITDESGPIGLAGVMGGGTTEMAATTAQRAHRGRELRPGLDRAHGAPAQAAQRGVPALRARRRPADRRSSPPGASPTSWSSSRAARSTTRRRALFAERRARRDRPARRLRRGPHRRRLHRRRDRRSARR